MENSVASYGQRIKFQKQGSLLVSYKIFSNGHKMVRLIIDTEAMTYKLVDPVTNFVLVLGDAGWTNLEVVQRNAKKALKEYLDIKFDKEVRNTESNAAE